jgi:excisionase family DNA binding protein
MGKKTTFYTAEEIAKILRLHPYTIRRLSREDKIPAFKAGGQWRYDEQDIEQWRKRKPNEQ